MSKSKESSPSSPSSPSSEKSFPDLSPPTMEEQVEMLRDVMKICGIEAGKVMREVRESYSQDERAVGLCPVIPSTGAWQQLTIALFQEACGVKHFQPTVISCSTEPNIRDIARKMLEL